MLFKNGLFGGWGRKAGMPVKKHGPALSHECVFALPVPYGTMQAKDR